MHLSRQCLYVHFAGLLVRSRVCHRRESRCFAGWNPVFWLAVQSTFRPGNPSHTLLLHLQRWQDLALTRWVNGSILFSWLLGILDPRVCVTHFYGWGGTALEAGSWEVCRNKEEKLISLTFQFCCKWGDLVQLKGLGWRRLPLKPWGSPDFFAAESASLSLGSLRDGKLHVQRPFPVLS